MYEIFSRLYDSVLGDAYHPVILSEMEAALRAHGEPPGRRLLDIGCGTGTLACEMASRGWRVTGVDLSPAMLSIARNRASQRGVEVEWVQDDMRIFRRPDGFDLAVCFYDTLNHVLTNADLMRVLRNIHDSLAEGGLLAFDVSNRIAFWEVWDDPDPFERSTPEGTLNIRTLFDRANRVGEARVEVVRGEERDSETIRQRFFSDTEIRGLLMAESFELVEAHDFEAFPTESARPEAPGLGRAVWKDHPDPEKTKTFWLCRRRSSSGGA